MLGQLLSPALRRTTLLLLFIWWANAVVYYGLVLLATTVRIMKATCSVHAAVVVRASSEAHVPA